MSPHSANIYVLQMDNIKMSKPRRIEGTTKFTQKILDIKEKKGYLALLSLKEVIDQRKRGYVYELNDTKMSDDE